MILVTGANGKTGRAVIKALLSKGEEVRAFVHNIEQVQEFRSLGVAQVIVGDMLNQHDVNEVFKDISIVYHICPAMNPNEIEIGQIMINAARSANLKHFVYHSVLNSRLQEMPHHQKKLMVEERLVNSGIPYTIIQPTVYMQNILESWKLLTENGIFEQRFFSTNETLMCLLDLEDLAEVVSIVLTQPIHIGATYEICGPENLSLNDMLANFNHQLGREIKSHTEPDDQWIAKLKELGLDNYATDTLLKMYHHYCESGFIGNSNTFTWLVGRKPNNFSNFIQRTIESYK